MNFFNKLTFSKQPWFLYLRLLFRHFLDDDCQQKASSLTYTTLLSLVPILTVIIVVFSVVPALADVREALQNAIYDNLLPMSKATISEHIESFTQKSSNLGLIGIVGLFVTTIMTLLTIEEAFNQIWRVKERSSIVSSVVRYWMMITLAPIVLGLAFGASGAIKGFSFLNQQVAGYAIDWSIWAQIITFFAMALGFVGMYWFIPKAQVPFKNAVIAGVVVAVLLETLKQVFGTVMSNFTSYEAIYGAFVALPVFLLWIYFSWNVILLGVEISYTLTIFENKNTQKHPLLLSLLLMLYVLHQNYQTGKATNENELRAVLGHNNLQKWQEYISILTKEGLIAHTKDDCYLLKMDLHTVNLWQFYQRLPANLLIKNDVYYQITQEESAANAWLTRLYQHLEVIENIAAKELDFSLGMLFCGQLSTDKQPLDTDTTLQSSPQNSTEIAKNNADNQKIEGSIAMVSKNNTIKDKVVAWIKNRKTTKNH